MRQRSNTNDGLQNMPISGLPATSMPSLSAALPRSDSQPQFGDLNGGTPSVKSRDTASTSSQESDNTESRESLSPLSQHKKGTKKKLKVLNLFKSKQRSA